VAGRRTSENLFLVNGVEYTGSSQLAISPGGVSGELLGIDAVREFNVSPTLIAPNTASARGASEYRHAIGTNLLHGSF